MFSSLEWRTRAWRHPQTRPRPAHVRSAGRNAARQPTRRPFFWPTHDLCRYGFIPRICGRYNLDLACTARSFGPGTAHFVPARLGTTSVTSASCPSLRGPSPGFVEQGTRIFAVRPGFVVPAQGHRSSNGVFTPTGLYEWLVMLEGSSAPPGWFVKVINVVIKAL